MSKKHIGNCQLCGKNVDMDNGGCALMITFCRNHSTNLADISYCNDCYNEILKKPVQILAYAACLEWLGVDDESEEE